MDESFIKLYRKFENWEWYQDVYTKVVFLHLIMMANYKSKKWRGIIIDRGQVLTGRIKLAASLGISVQNVRTALANLQSTNELTIKSNSQHSIITIVNYNSYQQVTSKVTSELTNDQPTPNQRLTTTKKDNNIKKDKKVNIGEYKNVRLHEAEYQKLCSDLGKDFTSKMIIRLDEYIEQTGKKYKNHALVIRTWSKKETNQNKPKGVNLDGAANFIRKHNLV